MKKFQYFGVQPLYRPDQRTGLYEEALFMELLEREVARARRYARPLSVILGSVVGLELSHEKLSRAWMALARDVDFGAYKVDTGWIMVLPETGRSGASFAAQRFRRGLELELGATLPVLAVVTYPFHGTSGEALLRSAADLCREPGTGTVVVGEFRAEEI